MTDKDKQIELLTMSHECVVIELAKITEKINEIKEVIYEDVEQWLFGTQLLKIQQILEED